MKKEYEVEVLETHYVYVDAETEDEAIALAEEAAFAAIPDIVESTIIKSEEI